jgi:F0F1-type ATP synthase delta subunit
LFALCQKALDAVEKDLKTITSILKTDPRLADFLNDPSVKKPVRESIFYWMLCLVLCGVPDPDLEKRS